MLRKFKVRREFPKLKELLNFTAWVGKNTLPYVVMLLCLLGAPFALIAALGGINTLIGFFK